MLVKMGVCIGVLVLIWVVLAEGIMIGTLWEIPKFPTKLEPKAKLEPSGNSELAKSINPSSLSQIVTLFS